MKRSSLLEKQNKITYQSASNLSSKQHQKSSPKITNQLYYDNTSPLMNLQKSKQKTLFKSQIHDNVLGKINYYLNNKQNNNKSMLQSVENNIKKNQLLNKSYIELKAASVLYKIPQFSTATVNFQVSSAIRQKVQQIKHDFITHLPDITKSSNFNPKKIQNTYNHRSSILQLQQWLKNKLVNPPRTLQESLQYKNMIMGIGMKDLIRIINKRCLEEGKMVEEIWELTWGVCREIIVYLGQRVRKCEEVLEKEVINVNKGVREKIEGLRQEVQQKTEKLENYQKQNQQIKNKIKNLLQSNQQLQQIKRKHALQFSNSNQQFLNVLQENLALYLHVGDKNKKDWIKRMYKKVEKAKNSVRKSYKENVTKTYQKRVEEEKVYDDEENGQGVLYDEEGNVLLTEIEGKRNKNNGEMKQGDKQGVQKQHKQNGQNGDQNQNNMVQGQNQEQMPDQDQLLNLKQTLQAEFQTFQIQTQTQQLPISQAQAQCQQKQTQQKQTQFDLPLVQQIGINTQQSSLIQHQVEQPKTSNLKSNKSKSTKNQKDKKSTKNVANTGKSNLKTAKNNNVIDSHNKNEASLIGTASKLKLNNNSSNQLANINSLSIQRQVGSNQKNFQYLCKQCQKIIKVLPSEQNHVQNSATNNNDIRQNNDISLIHDASKKATFRTSLHKESNNPQFDQQLSNKNTLANSRLKQKLDTEQNQDDIELFKRRDSQNFHEIQQNKNRSRKRKNSSLIHDLGVKKDIQKVAKNIDDGGLGEDQMEAQNWEMVRLSLYKKEPYYRLFLDQLKYANQTFIDDIVSVQANSQNILNNYFSMVQQINIIPDSKILMGEKQMVTIIQKNLMPIIVQLLSSVKKSIAKKNLDYTIRTFNSLPFTVMKKLSTKYGVKILAMKNMRLLLSSLKKIQTITDRYKSLKLMLFTDCRAIYSQDLFVYLLIFSTITPMLDVERVITFEEVSQVREICEKYLTTEKRVYEEFQIMTKEQFTLNKDHSHSNVGGLKISPLIRSIITNYRIVKLNRIQQIGFVFLMLNKQNYLQFQVFSYFMACLKLQIEVKLKIVKAFLANCDIKTKLKKVAISQSSFSKFLIRCPQFNFQTLNFIVCKQKTDIEKKSNKSTKILTKSKKVSIQSSVKDIAQYKSVVIKEQEDKQHQDRKRMQSNVSVKDDIQMQQSQSPKPYESLHKQKSMLYASRRDFNRKTQTNMKRSQTQLMSMRSQKNYQSSKHNEQSNSRHNLISKLPQKLRDYSYFTYRIAMFLQDPQLSKYMSQSQRQFLENYILIHIIHCQLQEVIGIIDYFSNDMLQVICIQEKELGIIKKVEEHGNNNLLENILGQPSTKKL